MSPAQAVHAAPREQQLADALRRIEIFCDLTEDQLQWFASHSEDLHVVPGEEITHEGDPADSLFVILEGEIQGRPARAGSDLPPYIARAGQVTGMLPFSRMVTFPLTIRAVLPTRGLRLHKDQFAEMLQRIPQLLPRLMGVMADRIRETSRVIQQHEKLMALGKISAGLAHELNNPAAAARRSSEALRHIAVELRRVNAKLNREEFPVGQRSFLDDFQEDLISKLPNAPPTDALAQSDREDEVGTWLQKRRIPDGWKLAGGLVEAGLDIATLDMLALHVEQRFLGDALARFVGIIAAEKLTREIEAATGRISELVRAVKEYSYMDRMAESEIDIHDGIENTLTILNFRLRKGICVTRQFDRTLPRVCARGSELNQVWTNLIDNAIDAMDGKGTLLIRTSSELENALVEIIDNGPGIPEEIKTRIFEPFFTTKGVGDGTGLGLDVIYRIVRNHHGTVRFDSRPGETCFQVRIPFQQPKDNPVSTAENLQL